MKIIKFKLHTTSVPFRIAFNHTSKSRAQVEAVMLEVYSDDGVIGYGEALPREYVTGETNQSVIAHARSRVLPALLGMSFDCFSDLVTWLGHFHRHFPQISAREQCIKTLIELALLDAYGKSVKEPVIELIGGRYKPELQYSGVISSGEPAHVEKYIQAYLGLGIREYKIKVGINWQEDISNIQRVRELAGKDVDIRVDANEAWELSEASRRLDVLASLGVSSCEQPMPASQSDRYPILRRNMEGAIKICIDESLCSLSDAYWFLEHRGADIFNLRVSKNGGVLDTLALAKAASASGIECQLGSQVGESSLLARAGQIVASVAPLSFLHHEGAYGTMLLAYDLTDTPVMFEMGGSLIAKGCTEPGLGVNVNREKYAAMLDQSVSIVENNDALAAT